MRTNRVFRPVRHGVVALAIALVSLTVTSSALAGNALNAKSCQKNGWMGLVTSGGATFTSETACTSYAARGGVLKKPQSISFTSAAPDSVQAGSASYTPKATSTSGLTVAITLDASSTGCSITMGVVSFDAAGTCVIDANQSGDAAYIAAAQQQQRIAVTSSRRSLTQLCTDTAGYVAPGNPGFPFVCNYGRSLFVDEQTEATASCAYEFGASSSFGNGQWYCYT